MNKKERVKEYKRQVAEQLFFSECYVCHKRYGKRFQFHHLTYRDNEKTYANFKNNNDDYQLYILPIIESRPLDFELLCNKHHYLVEILKRFKPERFERLFDVVRRSNDESQTS